jgi:hypothetical protein
MLVLFIGIGVVAILDVIIGKTLRHFYFSEDSGIYYRTTYSMDKTEADLLIFGTSRAYHHYAAKTIEDSLKVSSYNTGRDGEYIFYQTAVLKSVLKRYTPKMIILDFAGSFNYSQEDYDRLSVLLPYYKDHPEIRDIVELRSPFEKYKLISQIYPYNSSLLTIIAGNMEFNKKRSSNMDYHGYVPLHGLNSKKLDSLITPAKYEVDDNKIKVFTDFLSLTQQHNIPLVVVNSPDYYLYESDYSIDLARKLCEQRGIPFKDFSKDPEFLAHGDYFEDETHLNELGAEFFTKKVLNSIKEEGVFSKQFVE